MKKTLLTLLTACILLLLCACSDAAVSVSNMTPENSETLPSSAVPPDGDPGDVTCKGSYTGQVDGKTVVAAVGGTELMAGELQAWYWAQVAQFRQTQQEAAPDFDRPLEEQPCEIDTDVNSWQQYFLKRALNAWHGSAALALQGESEGLPIEEAYQPDLEKHETYLVDIPATKVLYGHSQSYQPNSMHQEYLDNIPEMLEELAREKGYANASAMAEAAFGTTEESLTAFAQRYNYGYMYFTSLSDYIEPAEEEFRAYLAENSQNDTESGAYVDIRHILLIPDDLVQEQTPWEQYKNVEPVVLEHVEVLSDGRVLCSEYIWARCEQEAMELLTGWREAYHPTEATFAELANKNSEDPGTALDGGLYSQIRQGQLLPELDSWCFDAGRAPGDTTVIRSAYGVHILYFAGSTDIAYAQAREDMMAQRQTALVTAAREAYPMEVTYSAITLAAAEGTVSPGDVLYPDVAHERYPEVPLYLQQDYPKTGYGAYKITTNGCGITSFAMLTSYMTDEEWTPPEMCAMYGKYSGASGTDGTIFIKEPSVMGFYFKEKTHDVYKAKEYLESGHIVVSLQHPGYWTSGGHYIVLERVTEDDRIQVRDSNLYNYGKIEAHKEDKHSWNSIRNNGSGYWVFEKKVTSIPACTRCGEGDGVTARILQEEYTCRKCENALLRRNTYLTLS